MKRDIILAGVGGQGILSISYLICNAALDRGWNFKQAEVHGMAQRGGAVQSHLRISDQPIQADLIPQGCADIILSVEPMEVFRYIQYLHSDGIVVTSTEPYKNIPNYPEQDYLMSLFEPIKSKVLVDSKKIAKECGSHRSQNIVMLGAGIPTLGFDVNEFDKHLEALFGRKGEKIVQVNKDAIRAGYQAAISA